MGTTKGKIKLMDEQFQHLLEKHFGKIGNEDGNIDEKAVSKFKDDLNKMNMTDEDTRMRYLSFILRNYMSRDNADINLALYSERELRLKIHNQVFYDYFSENPQPVDNKFIIMKLCGISDISKSIYKAIDKISANRQPVIITGETGTGKELHAKVIHYLSLCRNEKFLPINCSGIPEPLLESELFGHEKGAFTGATSQEKGLFEVVGTGTLFLDEISDMPMSLQAKLLRVLQTRDFRRVGGTKTLKFEGRVIAATNRDLKNEIVPGGRFRADLFYRLNVFSIRLQSLREMHDDAREVCIIQLMPEMVKADLGFKIEETDWREWSKDVRQCLLNYDYPGNFRELTNILIRALTLSEGGPIKMEHLPDEVKNFHSDRTVADTPPEKKESTIDVKLVDIFDYADAVTASIIKSKIEEIYEGGHELKKVIQTEMGENFTDSNYQTLRNKLEKVLGGKGKLKSIRDEFKKH